MAKISIIGTTSWGITLAVILSGKNSVRLWARTDAETKELKKGHFNGSEFTISPKLTITASLEEAFTGSNAVLIVVPSQSMRQNVRTIHDYLTKNRLIISAAKGMEIGTHKRMSEVIGEEINPSSRPNICVLSGPNLYKEILLGMPASAVVAAADEEVAEKAQKILNVGKFNVYTNTDIVGVELGGALKNIIALGAGMVDGLNYGDNAKAAFITRGLTEMAALGVAMGANPLTLSGLSGLGDLIATCASPLSRNHFVGVELTRGRKLADITGSMSGVAEGVSTTIAVRTLAQKLKMEMPITEKIYQILYENIDARRGISDILGAAGKHELVGKRWRLFSLFRRRRKPDAV